MVRKIMMIGNCPRCGKRIIRKLPVQIEKAKQIICKCGYEIKNPFLVFQPYKKYN